MSIEIREMSDKDAGDVARMVKALSHDTGSSTVPRLTERMLIDNRNLISVLVAVKDDEIIGTCLTLMTFSTWRGARGVYVVDLFVSGDFRGAGVGLALLRQAAKDGARKGATFLKLEVDVTNDGAARFYKRHGFDMKGNERLFVMEQVSFEQFIQ